MGIMMKPTEARAMAPEVMLARGVSWGREEDVALAAAGTESVDLLAWDDREEEAWSFVPRSCFARDVRKAFNVLK